MVVEVEKYDTQSGPVYMIYPLMVKVRKILERDIKKSNVSLSGIWWANFLEETHDGWVETKKLFDLRIKLS
jgi:hypothetical protein